MSVVSFLSQTIQGYNVTDMAKWVSDYTLNSPVYGYVSPALVLIQWGLESGWGGVDISTYFNPGNQASSCGCGSTKLPSEPNGLPAFSSIRDGVNSYANLLTFGYPHVLAAYADGGFSLAAQALGQGYYTGYNGGTVTYCGGQYTLTSQSGARIWAASHYGSPAGQDMISTLNANTNLQALNQVYTSNPLSGFDMGC